MSRNQDHPYKFIHYNQEVVLSSDPRTGGNVAEHRRRSVEAIERSLIGDTEELISILDGSTKSSPHFLNGERSSEGPFEGVVYLDKSARPVRKLVHGMMNGEEPQAYFLNIDKRPYLAQMGFINGIDGVNMEDISPEAVSIDKIDPDYLHSILTSIRYLYLNHTDMNRVDEKNLEMVWSLPTRIDGQTIAVLDEVKSSGNTLRIATELLSAAIPEARFEGVWWSTPGQVSWDIGEEKRQFAARFVPPWYDASTSDGRGIGEINERFSANSSSKTQRIGRQVLSAPLIDTRTGKVIGLGVRTKDVNDDIKTLVGRYHERELINYRPDIIGLRDQDRGDDADNRLMRYYNVDTPEKAYEIVRNNNRSK